MNTTVNPNVVSAIFAVLAAVLWFLSAIVRTPAAFHLRASQYDEHAENPVGGAIAAHAPGIVHSEDLARLASALIKQSRLSAAAAACACVSTIAQAVAVW